MCIYSVTLTFVRPMFQEKIILRTRLINFFTNSVQGTVVLSHRLSALAEQQHDFLFFSSIFSLFLLYFNINKYLQATNTPFTYKIFKQRFCYSAGINDTCIYLICIRNYILYTFEFKFKELMYEENFLINIIIKTTSAVKHEIYMI
jgi:hypothetical protein